MTNAVRKASLAREPREAFEITLFGRRGRPWCEVVALDGGGKFWRFAEESRRLCRCKACKPRRLEVCGSEVSALDEHDEVVGKRHRQPEAQMDCSEQSRLDRLVGVADHGLERRDHIADYIFGRVVK